MDFELDIDVVEEVQLPFCKPDEYQAAIHDEAWFLDEGAATIAVIPADIEYFTTIYHYNKCEYANALKSSNEDILKNNHRGQFAFMTLDSRLRAAVKSGASSSDLLSQLSEVEALATDYSRQLQAWNTAARVYERVGEQARSQHFRVISLLCATVDLPEHWLLFSGVKGEVGGNFCLAYLSRAWGLLEKQESMSVGWVREGMVRRMGEVMRDMVEESNDSRIAEARREMGAGLLRLEEKEGFDCPAHDCRSKIGTWKTPEQQEEIERQFRAKFSWMWQGM